MPPARAAPSLSPPVPPHSRLRPALAVLAVALLGGHHPARARQRGRRPRAAAVPFQRANAWGCPARGGREALGAVPGPGPSADSRVSPAGKAQQGLKERNRLGSLLGRGGCGSVWAVTRLSDMPIEYVPRDRIRVPEPWHGPSPTEIVPLQIVLLAKVPSGCAGVIQLLEGWVELPNSFLLVLERPERCQDLSGLLAERRLLPEQEVWELFRQVLEAVRLCTICGVLHRDIKAETILLNLATGQLKLIDCGCSTFLQDSLHPVCRVPRCY
ncbi:LOW QUALITY PROTEIN: serine/threonine-protein kinase pim-1-like [Oenanthe melanoleuca]|uniref:LOW QUALITY PROTEIN: serine/threonine-protein kinase pim-1-like n=1 Tax=Oenanthe melanoleuca TaxID=2939378 RepID=UPI0024C1ED39|nr:LOW QUALITY PROTEIN: serine/threonine-protein kinase pim-1-like [Oenanthe melanoleuca]